MSNFNRVCSGFIAALVLGYFAGGCAVVGQKRTDATMLLDRDSTPGRQGVIRLQELPAFPVDAKRRPIAMIDDGDDVHVGDRAGRLHTDGKPMAIEERRR